MKHDAFSGDYTNLKFVAGRKVAQIVIEIPLELATDFVSMFGTPNPAEGTPVAIARLVSQPQPQREPSQ